MITTKRIMVLAAALLSLAGTASTQPTTAPANGPTTAPATGYKVEEFRLWQLSPHWIETKNHYEWFYFLCSNDCRHVAYVAGKDKTFRVVVDGKPGPEFDKVVFYSGLSMSPDGKRVAYLAKNGEKYVVVVDGQLSEEYDDILELSRRPPNDEEDASPSFTNNGKFVAYGARKGNKWFVVVNGQKGPEYDWIGHRSITLSPNGKHVAYLANKEDKWFSVLDGKIGPEQTAVSASELTFTPDSNHLVYVAELGKRQKLPPFDKNGNPQSGSVMLEPERDVLVFDGKPGPDYDRLEGPVFSPDSKRVGYRGINGPKWQMVIDDRPGPEYGFDLPEGMDFGGSWRPEAPLLPIFSPDGRQVAYKAQKGEKWLVVLDGKPGIEYDGIVDNPDFSPDGKHVVYTAKKGNKWVVVFDGREGPGYDEQEEPRIYWSAPQSLVRFSPDSNRWAYLAKRGPREVLVVDGRELPEADSIQAYNPLFSADSKHFTYATWKDKKRTLFLDDKAFPEIDSLTNWDLIFSPDGHRFAYAASNEDPRKSLVVVDGQAGPEYEYVQSLEFSPDGKHVAYFGNKDRKYFLVVDGKVLGEYEDFFWPGFEVGHGQSREQKMFRKDGVLEFMTKRDHVLYRVTCTPVVNLRN